MARIGQRGCLIQVLNDERGLDSLLVPAPRRPMWDAVHAPARFRRRRRPAARRAPRSGGRWRPAGPPLTEDQMIAMLPESGRGLAIMRACVDDVTLSSGPGMGTVVSLEKRMAWRDDAPMLEGHLGSGQLRNAG